MIHNITTVMIQYHNYKDFRNKKIDTIHKNEAEIAPNSTILLEMLTIYFTNPIYDYPNLNQGLTDYLDSASFRQAHP
jgi:hypothetical protein